MFSRALTSLVLVALASSASAQLTVLSHAPAKNALNVQSDAEIVITFDRAVMPGSLPPGTTNVGVFGRSSGPAAGTFALESGGTVLRFTPARPFSAGEVVGVTLASALQAADASFLRSEGYAFEFQVVAQPAQRVFDLIDTIEVRPSPEVVVRSYGGQATDVDGDGFLDLAIVNEVSDDVRVALSRADGTALYQPILLPANPTGGTPSPNAAADFDRDGIVDLVTCDVDGDSVTVLLGNGDGTFAPSTSYSMGSAPHGIAVLDANGDGAPDVATANTGTNDVALRLNDGAGGLLAPSFFDGGGSGEYAMAAADMDEDGIFDLVVGARSSQRVTVLLGNGNGTFTAAGFQNGCGDTWMMVCGDVNDDGHMDVSVAAGFSGQGVILLGDGAGNLGAPALTASPGGLVATDLGDLDGDGDLDWVLSSFGASRWQVFVNDGAGNFSFDQEHFSPANASCALLYDMDNDGVLDFAGVDEIADVVQLRRNRPLEPGHALCLGDGSGAPCPCANPGNAGEGCRHTSGWGMRIAGSGSTSVTADDLVVTATQVPPGNTGIFYSGRTHLIPAVPLYDGLQCAGGDVRRYRGVFQTTGTAADTGFVAQDPSGVYFVPGAAYTFQFWSRDVAAGPTPCGTFANLSPGYRVTATP